MVNIIEQMDQLSFMQMEQKHGTKMINVIEQMDQLLFMQMEQKNGI